MPSVAPHPQAIALAATALAALALTQSLRGMQELHRVVREAGGLSPPSGAPA